MADAGTIGVEASARKAADTVKVTLHLHIPHGTHIEAHEPPEPFLVPTVARFDDLEVIRVTYPEPVEKHLGLPGPPLVVYEGEVSVTAAARADTAGRRVHGTVRYQPCVGGACLPPREQPWEAPIDAA